MKKYVITNIETEFGDAHFDVMTVCNDEMNEEDIRLYHTHSFYEIFIVNEDSRLFVIGDKKVNVNHGEMIIVGQNCEHIAGFDDGSYPYAVLSVALEKTEGEKGFYRYFKDILDSSAGIPIRISEELFEKIASYRNRFVCDGMTEYALVKSDISRLLAELFSFLRGERDDFRKYKAYPPLGCMKIVLSELVNSDMSVLEMATELGYSERHISRMIVKCFGKTLSEIRRDRKLATARKIEDR